MTAGTRGDGWALDDSGVVSVAASLDNGPGDPAELGQAYSGVQEAYPAFPGSDKAGFSLRDAGGRGGAACAGRHDHGQGQREDRPEAARADPVIFS